MSFKPIYEQQYTELFTVFILFLIFIGFLRTIILNYEFDAKNILYLSILFALWLYFVKVFTNTYIYFSTYHKLNFY